MANTTSPKIPFPPPLLFVGGFALGWYLDRTWPVDLLPPDLRTIGVLGGWTLILAGLVIMVGGLITFAFARTAVMPTLPARRLMTTGLYRYSRNPMYVGLTIAYAGGILLTNIAWSALILVGVLVAFDRLIVPRKERYLRAEFGDLYEQYCQQVRRWL